MFKKLVCLADHGIKYETHTSGRFGLRAHGISFVVEEDGSVSYFISPEASISDINMVIGEAPDDSKFYFEEGEYLVNSPLLIRRSNVTLIGAKNLSVLKCTADFSNFGGNGYHGVIDVRGVSGTELENIKIEGFVIDGNVGVGLSDGIYATYVGKSFTTGLTTGVGRYDSTTNGVTHVNKKGLTILNCVIKSNSQDGISFNLVDNSEIVGVDSNKNTRFGVYLLTCKSCEVNSNLLQNNSSNGIYISTSCNNNAIIGNTVQNNSGRGIYIITSSNNNAIIGNTVQNTGSIGLNLASSCNNNTITGNTVQNNGSRGINLASSCNNNTITGNTVQNNNHNGIEISGSSNNTVTGNVSKSNNIHGISLLSNSRNNNIIGNSLTDNNNGSNYGIYIHDNSNYNVVCSNQHNATIYNDSTGNKLFNNKQV